MSTRTVYHVSLLLSLSFFLSSPLSWAQRGPVPVTFARVEKRTIHESLELPGTVTARVLSTIATEVAGRVARCFVDAGDTVRRGEPLVQLDTSALEITRDAIKAQIRESQARVEQARLQLTRLKSLYESGQGIVSADQLDETRLEYEAREAQLQRLRADLRRIVHDIERSTIRAPFNGHVTRRYINPGEWVGVGDQVVELLDADTLEVIVAVPEAHVSRIRPGTRSVIRFDVIPDLTLKSKVRAVTRRAEPEARTFATYIPIQKADPRIAVGMLTTVRFFVGKGKTALFVPKDAIVRQGNRTIVYLIQKDNTVRPVTVHTGPADGLWIAVNGPLKPGDRVITRGNERLRPGMTVNPKPESGSES